MPYAVLWKAGPDSLVDDVRFLGGHGSGTNPYNNNHTADSDLHKGWDGQYPSLWVTHGGGGTFADIWTPNTFAQAGFYVSVTKTPGGAIVQDRRSKSTLWIRSLPRLAPSANDPLFQELAILCKLPPPGGCPSVQL